MPVKTGVQPGHLEAEKSHSWDRDEGLGLHISNKDLSCDPSAQEVEAGEPKVQGQDGLYRNILSKRGENEKRKERGREEERSGKGRWKRKGKD